MNRDLLVVFDGDCGLCQTARQWAEERDRQGRLRFVPYQDADLARLAPDLTAEQAAQALYLLAPDGRRYRGARAVFMTLRSLPGWWSLLGTVWALPPLSLLAEPFYRLVARHRAAVSRWLGLTQCQLKPPAERP
ncbi:MAG: thiol-disulfide oxidoreductase DCC family protein [Aggregatilineaceae bacterium]